MTLVVTTAGYGSRSPGGGGGALHFSSRCFEIIIFIHDNISTMPRSFLRHSPSIADGPSPDVMRDPGNGSYDNGR